MPNHLSAYKTSTAQESNYLTSVTNIILCHSTGTANCHTQNHIAVSGYTTSENVQLRYQ